MALIKCPECGKEVSSIAKSYPNCDAPINTAVRCPKCGNADTKVISGASKVVSVALWGAFAANKVMSQYVCNKCNHKF